MLMLQNNASSWGCSLLTRLNLSPKALMDKCCAKKLKPPLTTQGYFILCPLNYPQIRGNPTPLLP